jgi:4-hydroxybenzoate polyprenyltransferase
MKYLIKAIGKALLVVFAFVAIAVLTLFIRYELHIDPLFVYIPIAFCVLVYIFYHRGKTKDKNRGRKDKDDDKKNDDGLFNINPMYE